MRRGDGGFLLGAEALDGEAREAAKRAILDTEYDDEYDDSYDELAEVRGVAESKPAGDEEGTSAIAGGVQATGGRGVFAGGGGRLEQEEEPAVKEAAAAAGRRRRRVVRRLRRFGTRPP